MSQYIKLTIAGFVLFFIIGSLSSCKTTQPVYTHPMTSNTQKINEGEYVKLVRTKKTLNTNIH